MLTVSLQLWVISKILLGPVPFVPTGEVDNPLNISIVPPVPPLKFSIVPGWKLFQAGVIVPETAMFWKMNGLLFMDPLPDGGFEPLV